MAALGMGMIYWYGHVPTWYFTKRTYYFHFLTGVVVFLQQVACELIIEYAIIQRNKELGDLVAPS